MTVTAAEVPGYTMLVDEDGITVCRDPCGTVRSVFRLDASGHPVSGAAPLGYGYAIAVVESVGAWALCEVIPVEGLA